MLSKRLKEIRSEKDKTQQEIANYLGITRPAYTAYESGNRQPDFNTLNKLADYFNVTTDYLLGRTNKRNETVSSENKSEPDIRLISRRAKQMTAEQRERWIKAAELLFPEMFNKGNDDSNDSNETS